jgi:hypothetical protein
VCHPWCCLPQVLPPLEAPPLAGCRGSPPPYKCNPSPINRGIQLYSNLSPLTVTSIIRPLAEASSSSSSASTPDPDSSDDYPEIGASACAEPTEGGRLICMVAPNGDRSHNNSSRYPTIGRSEASDVWTPTGGLIQNLNLDFNAVRVQAIMEIIQRMAPDAPLAILAHQGVEATNLVIAEKSVGIPRREPLVGDNDRAGRV